LPFLKQMTVNHSKRENAKSPMFTGISCQWPNATKQRKRWFYDFGSEGCRFKSRRMHHFIIKHLRRNRCMQAYRLPVAGVRGIAYGLPISCCLIIICFVKADIVTLCHSALDHGGTISLLGAFDRIRVNSLPHKYPPFTAVARIAFDDSEVGNHNLTFRVLDVDGRVLGEAKAAFQLPKEMLRTTATMCIVFPINGMELKSFGEHAIDIHLDGKSSLRTSFYVQPLKG